MRSLLSRAVIVLLVTVSCTTAYAKDIVVKSTVSKVTVFPSGAQIVRDVKIDLLAGDQTVIVQGMPERLITSSLRVEGTGGKSFEIGAVDSKRILVDVVGKDGVLDKTERARLEKEIERIGDESAVLLARIKAAETQRRLIERLSELPGKSPVRGDNRDGERSDAALFSVDNWEKIFDLIGTRMAVADDLILKYRQERREKTRQINKLKKRLAQQPAKKERQMEVRVAIASNEAMKAGLRIKYQVREASWRPFYDARLSTGEKGAKPRMVLTRRAAIRQWSGEDWKNVKLSLSTTSPQKGAQAPVLRPKRLDLAPPMLPKGAAKPSANYYADKVGGLLRSEMDDEMMAAPAAPMVARALKKRRVRAVERRAVVRQYAFQAVFDIPGIITVLPTGDEKKVAISGDSIEPALTIKTVPKLNSTAFLYAKFTHDKKATPLLPGAVALYRDGTFTGNGFLPLVNAGEEHALGFGADDAVKVTRDEIKRTKGKSGVFTTSKVDERRYQIKIINRHSTPVNIEVADQIPYSVNEKVVVRLLPTSTRPSRQNIKEKRGILAWDFKLEAGGEKLIKLDYSITWPANQTLSR
jgi:uncharacterized protein (TIGR02231 family)